MYHFIYKTISNTGKYYIGRHSTKNLEDGYFGSGKWVRSIKDKSQLTREIIEYCSEDTILEREKYYLSENVGKENCMNFNHSPVGFSTGNLNPAHTEKEKERRSKRSAGDNNPAKRPEVRAKMSESQKGKISPMKGKKMSEEGRKNISESKKGSKMSEEGKKKLSQSRKEHYESGKLKLPTFLGKNHSEEYKEKMKEYYHNRPKKECPHCGKSFQPSLYGKWHGNKCKTLV